MATSRELVRNLAFETALQLSEDEEPAHPGLLKDLAQAIEKLERASTINDKRQREIEQAALARAAADVEATAKSQGLSDEAVELIKQRILGG